MPNLTRQKITNLDNSMQAALDVKMGQIISYMSGSLTATGTLTPTAAKSPVNTTLSTVGYATVVMSGSLSANMSYYTTSAGSVAGQFFLYAWKADGTAGASPFRQVTYTAYGT